MYPGREESDVSSFGASNNMTWSLVPPANISALAISQTVWPKVKKNNIEIWILRLEVEVPKLTGDIPGQETGKDVQSGYGRTCACCDGRIVIVLVEERVW